MTSPTYAQALTALTAQQVRDTVLLPALATAGSTVGGAPTSSPDRGIVEAESFFLADEQALRVGAALSISATTVLQADPPGETGWVDAAATWYQVPSNQGPGNTAGGTGRFVATTALWSIPLVCAPTAAPLTLVPGQIVQAQANGGQVFSLAIPAGASPIILSAAGSYKASAPFLARAPGAAAGNVAPGQITSLITAPAGLSVDLTGTQVLVTGAIDQETSAALVERALSSWGRLGMGWTEDTFLYLAKIFAPDVTRVSVDNANPFGPGSVGVYLAQASGTASGPSSTAGTDCYAVYQGLVATSVKRLGSGPLFVLPASVVSFTITAVLATDGSNPNLVQNASDALSALFNAIMGPFVIQGDLIVAILRGGSFVGAFEIPQDMGVVKKIVLNLQGFGGVAAIPTFTTSPALTPAVVVGTGQIVGLTLNITTVS